ncbi:MAG: hypothetical protein WCR21_00625 [Bacteroidota bacterium]
MLGFCKPVSSKKRFLPQRELAPGFTFCLFEKAAHIPAKEWNALAKQSGIFLHRDYLQIIESSNFAKLMWRYALVQHEGKACGIMYFQISDFNAGMLSDLANQPSANKHAQMLKKYVLANHQETMMRLITCGNNLISGKYGFYFEPGIDETLVHQMVLSLTEIISKEDKLKNAISATLIKDFELPLKPEQIFVKEKYRTFSVEPNMVVDIPPALASLEEYIQLFSKKYRNRAKSIFKKFNGIQIKTLSTDDVVAMNSDIYTLYESIFNEARFKLMKLPGNYFAACREHFEDKFFVKGFYLEDKLVAFYSYIVNNRGIVEAHYIGLNYDYNLDYCLYQNILYDLIKVAIEQKAEKLNLGRTASEIKTTVGALSQDLLCYIKPQNTVSKLIQKPLMALLEPSAYTPRNPFKEEAVLAQ